VPCHRKEFRVRLFRWVRRRPWGRILVALVVIWFFVSLGIAAVIERYGAQDHARRADVLIVLGAGIRPDNTPTPGHRARAIRASELWKEGLAPYVICTGGILGGASRSEADVCREILEEQGVPSDRIVLEDRSRSTEENALYSRDIMEAYGWRTAVVVSDAYHLLRANYLFHNAGIDAYTTPVSNRYMASTLQYLQALGREVIAVQWQVFTDLFNLPVTYVAIG
jgi:uncharacterized SAM-binding protein YcdF (DUF218 family)